MILSNPGNHRKSAAIVCEHIATQRCPILSAFRTPPDFPEDSGWQFFCGKDVDESPEGAKVWALGNVLTLEPSLEEYVDLEPNIQVWRPSLKEEWIIRKLE